MRRVRRKGGNKEKVFGCDLLEHLNASSQEIPLVLRCCSEFVEKHGIVDGIYRLSGVSSNIQKLRGEFESDGSPDLNKDLYLQDIHCVSSLCKAYFRELPNPLLTYQLYDKFAEAVAIQLEEDRLVKIRDVLKELPNPHYRTLEFLMRHLVRMASYSSETNMHSRNLAIVWAPNLLRSKDIEASGFNGTAAFMEVRVQSIVVEFILTHVPQLFPEQGVSNERRNSLPSPSAASGQEEGFFKSAPIQPFPNFGNISPGDGPLAIRPYHAIIEGTDKRKGSLKGRKWMSIFNIGGRFQDPRRRHKHSSKEKDRPALRPARSMDSLSTQAFPNEGSRRPAQRPPSTSIPTASPLVTPNPQSCSEVTSSPGAIGGSEYAVTYRRGTGLVSGGAGTQGTYTALDPEGSGVTGNESLQSRSPGLSTKVGRRAAMHITGPTLVTVPLHITSNLALGVLQGGGGNRVIHRGRDKDGGDRVEGKEGGEKVESKESRAMERKVEEGRKVQEEEKNCSGKVTDREGVEDAEGKAGVGGGGEEEGEVKKEEDKEEEEVREERTWKPEVVMGGQDAEEDNDEDAVDDDKDVDYDYIDMKGVKPADLQPAVTQCVDASVFDASNILNSTEVEEDDQGLSGYVQDNFDFLDQMDCSAQDHMDCSVNYQVSEFSVEPPGYSDDEYEVMAQGQPSHRPAALQMYLQAGPETHTQSQTQLNPHRPLSLDINSRHTKSLSLPYMTSPVRGPEDSGSEEEDAGDDSDDNIYSSDDDDDSMFVKSLPPDFFLSNLTDFEPDTDKQDCCTHDGVPITQLQSSEERECQSLNLEFSACKESTAGEQEQVEVKDKEDIDGLDEKETTKKENVENNRQSKATDETCSVMEDTPSDKEQPPTSEASTHCFAEHPLTSNDESSAMADITVEEEKEAVDNPDGDYPPCDGVSCGTWKERDIDEGEDECKETEDTEMVLEMKESDADMGEETTEEANEVSADQEHAEKMQEGGEEQDSAFCGTSSEVWNELEDVICEVIEDEESKQVQKKGARESVAGEGDTLKEVNGEEEDQIENVSGEKMVEVEEGGTNKAEVGVEVVEESMETTEDMHADPEMQQEFDEKETNLPNTSELDEAIQGKHGICNEAQRHDSGEVVSKEKENSDKERADEQRRTTEINKQLKEVRSDMKELTEDRKCEESDSSQGGVGRKLVISKHPKVYQVKAVPVVPPKPQHCRFTALSLRNQQQQKDRRDADRGRENTLKAPTEQDKEHGDRDEDGEDEASGKREKPTLRGGEKERDKRRDGDESATNRNSPLSMCFDEAVAKATMRREKEKECEKERQRDWGSEVE